jgi:hypothetical protein
MHTRHAPAATATATSATAVATASTTACAERGCISEEGRAGKEARSPQTAHGGRADGGRKRGISHQQNRMTTRNTTWHYMEKKHHTGRAQVALKKKKKLHAKQTETARATSFTQADTTSQVKSSELKNQSQVS